MDKAVNNIDQYIIFPSANICNCNMLLFLVGRTHHLCSCTVKTTKKKKKKLSRKHKTAQHTHTLALSLFISILSFYLFGLAICLGMLLVLVPVLLVVLLTIDDKLDGQLLLFGLATRGPTPAKPSFCLSLA